VRRLAAITLALLLSALAATLLSACGGSGGGSYRIDAIFDDAKGIIPGQLVKIAGARVGTIKDVVLTPSYQARVELQVPSKFVPFHADASCAIKPEGLIAENFVDCNPGTASSPPLTATGGHPPTVPVANDTEPVSITDLFNIWATPTADRLTVLINELGAGFAGRGNDVNAILTRANPALGLARKAIALVNRQRSELSQSVAATGTVIAQLSRRSPQVQQFIDRAANVTSTTAAHRDNLSLSVQRLPGLLAAAEPALRELDSFAAAGTPLLRSVHVAAPSLNRVIAELTPFSQAGVPAVNALTPVLSRANTALGHAAPLVAQLRDFTIAADPTSEDLKDLLVNLRSRGFVESLLGFLYNTAAVAARYDGVSHLLPAHLIVNGCVGYSNQPVAGCSAWYPNGAQRTVQVAPHPTATAPSTPAAPALSTPAPAPAAQGPRKPAASAPAGALPQPLQSVVQGVAGGVQSVAGNVQSLISQLQNAVSGVQSLLGGHGSSAGASASSRSANRGINLLLNYLLK
jgi:virulence factor Mce-like protein